MTDAVNSNNQHLPDLEALCDALPNGLVVIDRQGIIVLANTLVSKTLDVEPDNRLEGMQMWQALPEGLRETVAAMQREVLIYGAEAHRDFDLIKPDGSRRLIDVQLAPIAGRNGQPEFFSLSLNEAADRQEVVELKKLDHLKSSFMALISHELRTPLTSVRGAIHLLGESPATANEPEKTLVGIIQGNSERLIRLVNNLLEMVAIDNETYVVNPVPTDVPKLITAAVAKSQAAADAKFISIVINGPAITAEVDPERMLQFFVYLLDNALKFTPTGGRITLTTGVTSDGRLDVSVKDTGCGVPPHAREKIFDRFYQVEDPMTRCFGGAGVGLYLARHIVESHKGTIWVDSTCSEGANFRALLPVRAQAQGTMAPVNASGLNPQHS